MNRTRIALLGILALLVAVWMSYASLPPASAPPRPESARRVRPTAVQAMQAVGEQSLFDADRAARRLRTRREETPAPRESGRNPFEFEVPASRPAPAPAPAPAARGAAAAPQPVEPGPPPLTLSGIAENMVEQTVVRTAVISGLGQLFFVKVGDKVAGRFEVTAIGANAVELRDVYNAQITRLGLP